MSLGAFVYGASVAAQGPVTYTRVSFTGETSYVAGGNTGLLASMRAHFKDTRQILGIIPQDCGGFSLVYDLTNEKLKVYEITNAEGAAPEVDAAESLGATTFNMIVISY
jgi:hypothetical protein